MKIKSILIFMCFTFMQSYSAALVQAEINLNQLPRDVLVPIIVEKINKKKSLRDAWKFIQKFSLTHTAFARVIMEDAQQVVIPLVDALSKQLKSPEKAQKTLFNFCTNKHANKQKIGPLTAKMITRALLKAGADKDKQDSNGSALLHAAKEGYEGTARELINAGANVNKRGFLKRTALWYAASAGSEGMVRELIDAGAHLNRRDNFGHTPLMEAAFFGHEGIVRKLINAHVDVDKQDDEGGAALWYAARAGSEGIVRALLGAGANPFIPNAHDITSNVIVMKMIEEAIAEQQTQSFKRLKT